MTGPRTNTPNHQASDLFQLIVEAAPTGLLLANQDGVIVLANKQVEQMFGYLRQDLVGQPVELLLPAGFCAEHSQHRHIFSQAQSAQAMGVVRDLYGRRKDGSEFSIEIGLNPISLPSGLHYVASMIDITARKQDEQDLHQSAYQQLSFHIGNAPLALLEWTADMRLRRWSPQAEKMFGWRADEVEGKYPHEWRFVFTDDTEALQNVSDRLMTGRERQNVYQGRLYSKSGAVVHGMWHNSVLTDERGAIVSIISLIQDLSGQVRLEQQFHEAQKMDAIGRLAGGIAHDFNNLLTVINGYSDLALANRTIPPRVQNALQQILNAGHRAASLTQQLLAFSRQQVMRPQVLTINAVILNIEKLLRRVIGEDIKLICRLDDKTPRIKADPGQIEHIVMNMAVNARDAMPNGGQLIIETHPVELDDAVLSTQAPGLPPGLYALLAIQDTGIGMDDVTRQRIFEPFFTTKGPGQGSGLGLAAVHGIVQQSNGLITVSSQPGQGTRFHIYFPQATGHIQEEATTKTQQAAVTGAETILLVEDEPIVRAFARQVLTDHGYAVLEATTAEEALCLHKGYDHTIHLLLSDVVLPGGGGPLLAKQLRNQRPTIKVLLMSGYIDRGFTIEDTLAETTPFLQKPFTQDVLLRKIRTVLDTPDTNPDTAQQLSALT